jgi:hypothetical protein
MSGVILIGKVCWSFGLYENYISIAGKNRF